MRSCISLYDLFYKENEHHEITSLSGAPMAAYLRGVLYFSPAGIFSVGLNYLTKEPFLSGKPLMTTNVGMEIRNGGGVRSSGRRGLRRLGRLWWRMGRGLRFRSG